MTKKLILAAILAPFLVVAHAQTIVIGGPSSAGSVTGGSCPAGQYATSISSSGVPTCATATSPNAANQALSNLTSLSTAQTNLGLGVHLNAYAHGSPSSCSTSFSGASCIDETSTIQNALNACAASHGYLYIDPPATAAYVYFATHLTITFGCEGIVGMGHNYDSGGAALNQIIGANQDFMVTDPARGSSGYWDYFLMDNVYIQGDQTGTSTTGRGLVFQSHVGERTWLNRVTVNNFPNDGIATTNGSDPLLWNNIEASGNGYGAAGGCGINLTKTGGDPWDSVDIRGISTDNDNSGGTCLNVASNYFTADTIHLSAIKGETRSDDLKIPNGLPALVVMTGMNGTPVTIDGLSGVVVNPSAAISTVALSACSGTACTLTVNFAAGYVPPTVGQMFNVANSGDSGLNAVYTATANTATSVTATYTGSKANESVSGGNLYWNRTTTAAILLKGSNPVLSLSGISLEGGPNSTGSQGYANFIVDASNNVFPTSLFGGASGGSFATGQYFNISSSPTLCADAYCYGTGGFNVAKGYENVGDTSPRLGLQPQAITMGPGNAGVDTYLSRAAAGQLCLSVNVALQCNGAFIGTKFHSTYNAAVNIGTDSDSWNFDGTTGFYPTNGANNLGTVTYPVGTLFTKSVASAAAQTTLTGTTAGTLVWSQPQQGSSFKQAVLYLNGYENTSATAQTITLPMSFATVGYVSTAGGLCSGISISGATITLPVSMTATQTGFCEVKGY